MHGGDARRRRRLQSTPAHVILMSTLLHLTIGGLDSGISYEPVYCDGSQPCPKWMYCDEQSFRSICSPCESCIDESRYTDQCFHAPTKCLQSMTPKVEERLVCPLLDLTESFGSCRILCRPQKYGYGSPLGTICSSYNCSSQFSVECVWQDDYRARWTKPLPAGVRERNVTYTKPTPTPTIVEMESVRMTPPPPIEMYIAIAIVLVVVTLVALTASLVVMRFCKIKIFKTSTAPSLASLDNSRPEQTTTQVIEPAASDEPSMMFRWPIDEHPKDEMSAVDDVYLPESYRRRSAVEMPDSLDASAPIGVVRMTGAQPVEHSDDECTTGLGTGTQQSRSTPRREPQEYSSCYDDGSLTSGGSHRPSYCFVESDDVPVHQPLLGVDHTRRPTEIFTPIDVRELSFVSDDHATFFDEYRETSRKIPDS